MREIKFRVWCKDRNEWEKDEVFLSQNGFQFHTRRLMPVKSDNHTVVFYIGPHDKNGKEIYEGDIVSGEKGFFVDNVRGVVKYCGMAFCFVGKTESGKEWIYTVTNESTKQLPEIEVIGNIFENPELLTTNKEEV